MIHTEIISATNFYIDKSLEAAVDKVNSLIDKEKIDRADILEYKTSSEFSLSNHYKTTIIITWWK